MTKQPHSNPAAAGVTLLATIILCAGVGFGIGSIVGATVLLTLAGVFLGSAAGFALVYTRFKDI